MKRQKILVLILLGAVAASLFFWKKSKEEPKVVTVVIPEGSTVAEVNGRLEQSGVLSGTAVLPQSEEGYLFPDTYQFYAPSTIAAVEKKFEANFKNKTAAVIPKNEDIKKTLIIASLIEKEAATGKDQGLVSGIIEKRLQAGIPLQIDSTICYIKPAPCLPIRSADLRIDSPYNTYEHKGLPLGPIDNPGLASIEAALNPQSSPYWYYLSNRAGKVVYARTLDEQERNVVKYLTN
ncbi:MAG TPA: endolytic transglycosylase MltG [Candidatus Tyrphobacter sp.]|nr:endolytic transglycosylase MltG [Candidatus Tyrphobacter sp.]